MNSVRSNCQSLKYPRFAPSGIYVCNLLWSKSLKINFNVFGYFTKLMFDMVKKKIDLELKKNGKNQIKTIGRRIQSARNKFSTDFKTLYLRVKHS